MKGVKFMKSFKRVIGLLLALSFILTNIFFVSAQSNSEIDSLNGLYKNYYNVALLQRMLSVFSSEIDPASSSGENAESSEIIYPDDYAGAYIDEENNLHVKIIGKGNIQYYKNLLQNDSNVIFEEAETSLNDLNQIQDLLDEVMFTYNIELTSLQQDTNTIDIHLKDMSMEAAIIDYLCTHMSDFNENSITFYPECGIEFTSEAVVVISD